MPTLIWLACIPVFWGSASGRIDGYHVEVSGNLMSDVTTVRVDLCLNEKYIGAPIRVQAFRGSKVGPWSDPLTVERVHDFDADGNGALGLGDFGLLNTDFEMRYLPSGVAVPRE